MKLRLCSMLTAIILAPLVSVSGALMSSDASGWKEFKHSDLRFSIKLPASFKVSRTQFSASNYSTGEMAGSVLRVPALESNDKSWNALSIDCPSGSYAVLFAVDGDFLSPQELQIRFADYRLLVQQSASKDTAMLFQTYSSSVLFAGVPTNEVGIDRATNSKDSLFSSICLVKVGLHSYGLIMRSRSGIRDVYKNTSRSDYLMIMNNFVIEDLFTDTTRYICSKGAFEISIPKQWPVPIRKQMTNPLPLRSELSDKKNPLVDAGIKTESDTAYNAIAIQLPQFQLEIVSAPCASRTFDELHSDFENELRSYNPDTSIGINTAIKSMGSIPAIEFSYKFFKRGDFVRFRYLIAQKKGRQVVARITAWDRDISLVEKYLQTALSTLKIY